MLPCVRKFWPVCFYQELVLVLLREKNNPSVLLLFISPLIIYEYSSGSKNQRGLRLMTTSLKPNYKDLYHGNL